MGRWSLHPQKLQMRPRCLVTQGWPPRGDASGISTLTEGDEGALRRGKWRFGGRVNRVRLHR